MADLTRTQKVGAAACLAAALAAPLEGLRQFAYYDPPGILTVCEGHTGPDVVLGKRYTIEACKAYMTADMLKAATEVDKCHPGLPMNVLVAFSDAAFNIGSRLACDATKSTAARKLYAHDYPGACKELLKWDKANVAGVMVALPGLTKRRQLESELCLSPS